MRFLHAVVLTASFAFLLSACNKSDTQKLTDDAKAAGQNAKQTTLDALGAAKNTTDNIVRDTKKAANSDTAKDIEDKTKKGARKVADKTRQTAQDAKDAINNNRQNPPQ